MLDVDQAFVTVTELLWKSESKPQQLLTIRFARLHASVYVYCYGMLVRSCSLFISLSIPISPHFNIHFS